MALTQTQVSELYVAVFGRASEGEGNTYWATYETTESAATEMFTLDVVSNYFSVSNFTEEANVRTVVEAIYLNALGKAPADDVAGIQYWVDSIIVDGNAMGVMVAGLVASANDPVNAGAAQDTFNNKVAVSNYTADTVETFTDFATFQGFIASVDETSASVDAAKTSIDGSSTFSLTTGLAALEAAQDAEEAFLLAEGQDPDVEGEEAATTGGAIETIFTNAEALVDADVDGAYAGASATVKAALLAAQELVNAEALAALTADVDDANTAIAEVDGLPAAVATLLAAEDAFDAADAASTTANSAVVGADAAYENLSGETTVVNADGTVTSNGVVTNLIVANATTGALEIGVDGDGDTLLEADYEGLTALFNAVVAREAADVALAAADAAEDAAEIVVGLLDAGTAGGIATALGNIGDAFAETAVVDAAEPTAAEIEAEIVALTAAQTLGVATLKSDIALIAYDTDDATTLLALTTLTDAAQAAGFITAADNAAIEAGFGDDATVDADFAVEAALDAAIAGAIEVITDGLDDGALVTDFTDLVTIYYDAEIADSPLLTALTDATALIEPAEDVISDLADLVAAEAEALVAETEITALEAAITAATDALDDADYVVANTGGVVAATADNDAYLVVADGTITSFGATGSDAIFIGDAVLNAGDADTDGDNAVLEFFLEEDLGGNTTVTVETSTFGSNAATPEVVEVVLTGVAVADITIADGLITVA